MKKLLSLGLALCLAGAPMLAADKDEKKETERIEEAGQVLKEILTIFPRTSSIKPNA